MFRLMAVSVWHPTDALAAHLQCLAGSRNKWNATLRPRKKVDPLSRGGGGGPWGPWSVIGSGGGRKRGVAVREVWDCCECRTTSSQDAASCFRTEPGDGFGGGSGGAAAGAAGASATVGRSAFFLRGRERRK